MEATVRQRSKPNLKNDGTTKVGLQHLGTKPVGSVKLLREPIWLMIFAFLATILLFIHSRDSVYPEPKTVASAVPGEFVEELGKAHLDFLTSLGDRPVGSHANEVVAVKYILDQLNLIKENANPVHKIEIDVQQVSGNFTLHDFLGQFTSVYENLNNIILKLSPVGGAEGSLLVNSHYDSIVDSPGASDDAVSCALMLEVLRVISLQSTPLKHNVIFIFNGAEENILQASHGFITQHPWRKDVKAFVNLEAAGAGGRELLFQAGPEHPWMIQIYAKHVPHPFASVMGQEVFESGIIPSDTDFRIYRDYGNIPGLDIAYISNGYVYHTAHDTPDQIPPGCIQRGGENLLAVVRAMADSPYLTHPDEFRHGRLIFFDFVGLFMVVYSARLGSILNFLAAFAIFFRVASKIFQRRRGKATRMSGVSYVKHLVLALAVVLTSWVLATMLPAIIGYGLPLLGCPMTWYSHPWVLVGLYVCPVVAVLLSCHCCVNFYIYSKSAREPDLWAIEEVYFDAVQCIFASLLAYCTHLQISSSVLLLVLVASPFLIRNRLLHLLKANSSNQQVLFMLLHLLGTFLPSLLTLYLIHALFITFVPLMGRAGTDNLPDVFIAVLVAVSVILATSYHMSLVYISRSIVYIIRGLCAVFFICLFLVIFTPVGFPFSDKTNQRHIILHVDRTFHAMGGAVTKQENVLWHLVMDPYAMTPVKREMAVMKRVAVADCQGPYCGWPYYFPLITMLSETYRLPAAPISVSSKATLNILSRTALSPMLSETYRLPAAPISVSSKATLNILSRTALSPMLSETYRLPAAPISVSSKATLNILSRTALSPMLSETYRLPAAPISVSSKATLNILSRTALSPSRERITFTIEGPTHMTINVAMRRGVVLDEWSLGDGLPMPTLMPEHIKEANYFIYYSYAKKPARPIEFWFVVEVADYVDRSEGVMELALSGHYFNNKPRLSPDLKNHLSLFPNWTVTMGWMASYEAWTI